MSRTKPTESTFLRVLDDRTHEVFCTRCGGFLRVVLPMRIQDYTTQLMAFNRSHRNCEEKPVTAAAVLLHCVRCGAELDNVSPGFSVTADGLVCANCLKPNEELARARSM